MAGFRFATGAYTPGGVGKQSLAHLRIGDHADAALRQRLAEAFVVAEEKQPVLLERTAQRAAELVLPEGRDGRSGRKSSCAHRERYCAGIRTACRAAHWFPIA